MSKETEGNLLRTRGPGRPKGVPNKATIEAKELARRMVTDPAYLASLARRVTAGKAPHMEVQLWQYAYGKPKDEQVLTGTLVIKWQA